MPVGEAIRALHNDSFFDPYDPGRFTTDPTTTVSDQVVVAQGGGGSVQWGLVVGYSLLGLGFAVLAVVTVKYNPELSRRFAEFFGQIVGRVRVLLARGDGQPDDPQYELAEMPPLPPPARPLPLNRTDSDRLAALERLARSTCV